MTRAIISLVTTGIIGLAIGGWDWFEHRSGTPAAFRTAEIRTADVIASISATGTIVPEDTIDIGAQVNGRIASFGSGIDSKPVDYRSEVRQGALLAKIDDALYVSDVASAQAGVVQAEAQLRLSQADRQQAQAKLTQAEQDWGRAKAIGSSEALSRVTYDADKSEYEQAVAGLAVAEAQIGVSEGLVGTAKAALDRAQTNLNYCTIDSPVSGVIVDKRVDIGQTVIASQSAPSLFLIAKDLRRMLVLVQVNEADIDSVIPERPVTFTVDAIPGRTFKGVIRKVRLNATMTQNVVTYTAEIAADNTDLKLLPYLTANVTFITAEHDRVLAVPNAALRFTPIGSTANIDSLASSGKDVSTPRGKLWIVDPVGAPKFLRVSTGISDGTVTEVQSDELTAGKAVIVGESPSGTKPAISNSNPFTPQAARH